MNSKSIKENMFGYVCFIASNNLPEEEDEYPGYDEKKLEELLNYEFSDDEEEQRACRCGSFTHQRTNHSECPLNKRTLRDRKIIDHLDSLQQELDNARAYIALLAPKRC